MILLRVKVRKEGYDDSRATKLTSDDHCDLLSCWDDEDPRMIQIIEEHNATHPEDVATNREDGETARSLEHGLYQGSPSSSADCLPSPSISSDSEGGSARSRTRLEPHFESPDDCSDCSASSSLSDLRRCNLFGWDPDPKTLFLPLVDLWFELQDHLEEGNIPSPLEFYEEQAEVKG